jgi:hypothetical protein
MKRDTNAKRGKKRNESSEISRKNRRGSPEKAKKETTRNDK